MIKIDLITGFLGSGKTTFLKKYAKFLLEKDLKIGIIENDYGAVNVDMMLLKNPISENCELEMIAGSCDKECHMRRLKTKLISMKMRGFDRIIVEPSGVFDIDEFFDILHDEPLDAWYKIGSVITIVDSQLPKNLSKQSRYLFASQIAVAGKILFSKVQNTTIETIEKTKQYIQETLKMFHGKEKKENDFLILDWNQLTEDILNQLTHCGYQYDSIEKLFFNQFDTFQSIYIMNKRISEEYLKTIVNNIINDSSCGNVYRIKGFMRKENQWIEINITKESIEINPIDNGQEVIIVIGENLEEKNIQNYFA